MDRRLFKMAAIYTKVFSSPSVVSQLRPPTNILLYEQTQIVVTSNSKQVPQTNPGSIDAA